jgi:hypothetical protein
VSESAKVIAGPMAFSCKRRYFCPSFLHDRKRLAEISRCDRHALRSFLKAVPESATLPGVFIASIENPTVIRRILEHLGLWLANAR